MAFPAPRSFGVGSSNAALSVTVAKPSGLAVGDLMLAYIVISSYSSNSSVPVTPTGWTQLAYVGATSHGFVIYYKVADSSDVAASNFNFVTGSAGGSVNSGIIYAITGYNPSMVITASNNGTGNGTALLTPGVTVALPSLLLLLAGQTDSTNGGTNPSFSAFAIANNNPTWTVDAASQVASGTSGHAGIGIAHANYTGAAASATGNATATDAKSGDWNLWIVNIQQTTFVSDFFGATFGTFAPTIRRIIAAIFGATFGTFAPTVIITVPIWLNQAKSSVSSFINQTKS